MCRIAAYLGPAAPLSVLLRDPPWSLTEQAYRPRRQEYGTVNVDGTAVVWWPPGEREPLRYATERPPWADPNLLGLAPRLRGTVQLAAVRSATPGLPFGADAAAPFLAEGLALAHNGRIEGFRGALGRRLLGRLPDDLYAALGPLPLHDSVALLLLTAWKRRERPAAGLAAALAAAATEVAEACQEAGERATLTAVAAEHGRVAGVRLAVGLASPALFLHLEPAPERGAALVASEPLDDRPGWAEIGDRHLLDLSAAGATLTPLERALDGDVELTAGGAAGADRETKSA
jgi:glutamine amidotransferase